jgi:CMP-N,N'-diacetyllegionaminic acid synthase
MIVMPCSIRRGCRSLELNLQPCLEFFESTSALRGLSYHPAGKGVLMGAQKREVLAIIPARGGSQGIPHKNIVPLGGKPLISYTIEAALAADKLTRVVVSTDDEVIASTAEKFGAEVPFLRPAAISGSKSLLEDSFNHMIDGLHKQGYSPEAVVFLYCTSPFRTPKLINFLVQKLLEGHLTVMTVKKFEPRKFNAFSFADESRPVRPLRLWPRQGANYFRSYGIFSGKRLNYITQRAYMHVVDDPYMLLDIDTTDNLSLAESIVQRNLFDFGLS